MKKKRGKKKIRRTLAEVVKLLRAYDRLKAGSRMVWLKELGLTTSHIFNWRQRVKK